MTLSWPEKKVQAAFYQFFQYIRRKSSSLEYLIYHLALVVRKSWPKKT